MNNIFWNQLLSLTEELNSSVNAKEANINALITQLESICICHERSFEPADEFEEYVTLSLCKAIADTLNAKP